MLALRRLRYTYEVDCRQPHPMDMDTFIAPIMCNTMGVAVGSPAPLVIVTCVARWQ